LFQDRKAGRPFERISVPRIEVAIALVVGG
jgi:hypothetical protein